MGKSNRRTKAERFVKLQFYMIEHPSWLALSANAKVLFIEFKHRFNGSNNGYIGMSCRDAGKLIGCSRNTAQQAFFELEYYGFIVCRRQGTFGTRKASEYLLTCESFNNQLPNNDWRNPRPALEKNARTKKRDLQSHVSARNEFMEEQIVTGEGL